MNNNKDVSIKYNQKDKNYYINEIENIYNNQTTITLKVDYDLKFKFEKLCLNFGMDPNTAINIFLRTVVREKRIPFEIKSSEFERCSRLDIDKTTENV